MIAAYQDKVNVLVVEGINDPPTGLQSYTLTVWENSCKDCQVYEDTVQGDRCIGGSIIKITLEHECGNSSKFTLDVGRYYAELSIASIVHSTFDLFVY